MAPISANHFWALLIGIDFYIPGNSRLGDNGKPIHYHCLTGAVNDVLLVRRFLLDRGAPESNITTITATTPAGEPHPLCQPTPSEKAEAVHVDAKHQVINTRSRQGRGITWAMIIAEFETVTRSAQPGDSVYIHYSGHGGRAKSVYQAIKGPNALDESLVPSDIEMSGGQYVRDVELAFLLHQMVKKGLSVTLVLDSCHSGGATRAEAGGPPIMVRGIGVVDAMVLESDRTGAFDQKILFQQGDIAFYGGRNAEGRQGWLLDPQGYTLLAACLGDEWAHEFYAPLRTIHGVFTFSLISALRRGSGTTGIPTNELIHGEVHAMVQSHYTNQTPVIQGEGTTTIFGGWAAEGNVPIRVLDRHWREDPYVLGVGLLHGVSEGDEYVILAADGPPEGRELATVEVKEVSDFTCTVVVIRYHQPNGQEAIQPGCEAVFVKPGRTGQQRVARLVVDPRIKIDENGGSEHSRKIQKLIRDLAKPQSSHPLRPRWRVIYNQEDLKNSTNRNDAQTEDRVSFLVYIQPLSDSAGIYIQIRDLGGSSLPRIPTVPLLDPSPAGTLSNYMEHILKYRRVQALTEYPHPDSTGHSTSFDLVRVSKDKASLDTEIPLVGTGGSSTSSFTESSATSRSSECRKINGVYQVPECSYIQLLFRNPTNQTVYLTLLDLQPAWGIAKIYPRAMGGDYEEVAPGDERSLQFRMTIPESTTEFGRRVLKHDVVPHQVPAQTERFVDHLKAIVMLHPSSLKQLLQSSIVPPPETRVRDGSSGEESTESFVRKEQDNQSGEEERDDGAGDDADLIPDLYGEIDEILDLTGRNVEECGDTDGKGAGSRHSQPRSWYAHDIKIETVPQEQRT